MIDRFLAWLGAGVVTAGVSAAMIAGAGHRAGRRRSDVRHGSGTSSESSNSTGEQRRFGQGHSLAAGSRRRTIRRRRGMTTRVTIRARKAHRRNPMRTPHDAAEEEVADDVSQARGCDRPGADGRRHEVRVGHRGSDQSSTATVKAKPADTLDRPLAAVTEPAQKAVVEEAWSRRAVVEEEPAETSTEPAATVEPALVVVEDAAVDTPEPAVTAMAVRGAGVVQCDRAHRGGTAGRRR